jgi:uncharacterized protein (TIGR03435 family)
MSNKPAACVVALTLLAPVLGAQSRPVDVGHLSFDVVSVKTNKSGPGRRRLGGTGNRWSMVNIVTGGLIQTAYPTKTGELVGAPGWVDSEAYDIDARAAFEPSADELRMMLRALLADRFTFAAHFEMRERPIYNLVVARADRRLGPQLRHLDVDCLGYKPRTPLPSGAALGLPADTLPCSFRMNAGDRVTMVSGGRTMEDLADEVASTAGRPAFDKTGLAGNFAFTLEYADQGTDGASLFTALQEQLGLRLEPARGPVEILVVDHIERPKED